MAGAVHRASIMAISCRDAKSSVPKGDRIETQNLASYGIYLVVLARLVLVCIQINDTSYETIFTTDRGVRAISSGYLEKKLAYQ